MELYLLNASLYSIYYSKFRLITNLKKLLLLSNSYHLNYLINLYLNSLIFFSFMVISLYYLLFI